MHERLNQLATMLQAEEESQDYKQKYYEIFAIFNELREIAHRPVEALDDSSPALSEDSNDSTAQPFTATAQLELLYANERSG
jgi:hypothetical protein